MNCVRAMSWTPVVACMGVVLHVLGCDRGKNRLDNAKQQTIVDAPATRTTAVADTAGGPGNAAIIRIAPRASGRNHQPVLAFCYEEGDAYDPQIYRIRMARVDGHPGAYEITAVRGAWLWKEWSVGTVPPGFKPIARDALAAGVYEVYVDAIVGEGQLRVSIDDRGNIRSLPWDNFDTQHGKQCAPNERTAPRVIPKGDSGKEGLLEKHARELKERRLRDGK